MANVDVDDAKIYKHDFHSNDSPIFQLTMNDVPEWTRSSESVGTRNGVPTVDLCACAVH